jgi:hypothetical protein
MNITSCVPENTAYNFTIDNACSCKAGYYGTFCENYNEWYISLNLTGTIYQTVVVAIVFIWMIIRLVDLKKINKLNWNLALTAMFLNFLANLILISYIWIPGDSIEINQNNLYVIVIFAIVLVYSPTVLWLASTNLIVGFWFGVLNKKVHEKLSPCTKILVITSSISIIVLAIVGICIALFDIALIILAVVLILAPLVIAIIIAFVISIRVISININNLSSRNIDKKRWVSTMLMIICSSWIICVLLLIISLVISTTSYENYSYVISFLLIVCEGLISILLMLLFDYKLESIRRVVLSNFMSLDSTNTSTKTATTSTRTNSASSPRISIITPRIVNNASRDRSIC